MLTQLQLLKFKKNKIEELSQKHLLKFQYRVSTNAAISRDIHKLGIWS